MNAKPAFQKNFTGRLFSYQISPHGSMLTRREANSIQLRKQMRTQGQFKRRAIATGALYCLNLFHNENVNIQALPPSLIGLNTDLANPVISTNEKLIFLKRLLVESQDLQIISEILEVIDNSLNTDDSCPYSSYIYLGFVPLIQKFLGNCYPDNIVKIALRSLANLSCANAEGQMFLFRSGVAENFMKAIDCSKPYVCKLALQGLANLASDSYEIKQAVWKIEFLDEFERVHVKAEELKISISHYLSAVCCHTMELSVDIQRRIMGILGILLSSNESLVKSYCLKLIYALITVYEATTLKLLIEFGYDFIIANCLYLNNSVVVLIYSLRITAMLLYYDHPVDSSILDKLDMLFNHREAKIQTEIPFAIKNYALSSKENTEKVINHRIFNRILQSLMIPDNRVSLKAASLLKNILKALNYSQLTHLSSRNLIHCISESLTISANNIALSKKLLEICDFLLNRLSNYDEPYNELMENMIEAECLDKITDLTVSSDSAVASLAIEVSSHFVVNTDNEDLLETNNTLFNFY